MLELTLYSLPVKTRHTDRIVTLILIACPKFGLFFFSARITNQIVFFFFTVVEFGAKWNQFIVTFAALIAYVDVASDTADKLKFFYVDPLAEATFSTLFQTFRLKFH